MYNFHHLCCITMPLYIIPILYYYDIKKLNSPHYNVVIFLSLCCIICSNLFWINPIQNNIYHKIDGIIAKITYCYITFYTLFINLPNKKNNLLIYEYCIINVIMLILFLISNYFSSKKWCSIHHIYFHILFHLSGLYSYFYTHC